MKTIVSTALWRVSPAQWVVSCCPGPDGKTSSWKLLASWEEDKGIIGCSWWRDIDQTNGLAIMLVFYCAPFWSPIPRLVPLKKYTNSNIHLSSSLCLGRFECTCHWNNSTRIDNTCLQWSSLRISHKSPRLTIIFIQISMQLFHLHPCNTEIYYRRINYHLCHCVYLTLRRQFDLSSQFSFNAHICNCTFHQKIQRAERYTLRTCVAGIRILSSSWS